MRRPAFLLLLLLAVLQGCQSVQNGGGDFAQFFVSEVHRRGGRTLPVATLSPVEGRWIVERDDIGVVIHLLGAEFAAVDALMTQLLGPPKLLTEWNEDGELQRMYDGKISGMHIQLVAKRAEILIVAVGPKKKSRNDVGAGDGTTALLFHVGHLGRAVPNRIRWVKYL